MGQDRQKLGIVRRLELTIGVLFAMVFVGCAIYDVGAMQHYFDDVFYRSALMRLSHTVAPSTSPFVHQAAYPAIAMRNHQEGRVVLNIVIDEDGSVVDADVAETSGFSQLDAAALTAVGDWRYPPPTKKDGKATVDHRKVAVVFKVQD